MADDLVRRLTPEEEELQKKQAEISSLESELAQNELDLATLHAELSTFERKYQQIIGVRYAELDRIEAQITEYMVYLESSKNFQPSDNLKQLYRKVAKCIHPDLSIDETEKLHRQKLMAEANQAYEDGDEERLKNILYIWESSAETVKGEDVASELIRTIRKISQMRIRIGIIIKEITSLQQSELYQLKTQVMNAEKLGRDLLEEMKQNLDIQISSAKKRLDQLKEKI